MSYLMPSDEMKAKQHSPSPFYTQKSDLASESFFKPLAIDKKLKLALQSAPTSFDAGLKNGMENYLNTDFSQVSLHNDQLSDDLNKSYGAKAFTLGSHVFVGSEFNALNTNQRTEILAHELVHSQQQKNAGIQNLKQLSIDRESSASEYQAEHIADQFTTFGNKSQAKNKLPISTKNKALIQCAKSIKSHPFTYGDLSIEATDKQAEKAGEPAGFEVTIRFMPNPKAPDSKEIRFIQVVRSIMFHDEKYPGGAVKNKIQTERDYGKNIAPGFRVDHFAPVVHPRTDKSEDAILPYYDKYGHGESGKKIGTDRKEAWIWDHPGSINPMKFNFITTAMGIDTDIEYGSVLWGFEVYHSGGIAKVKDFYFKFRNRQGPTSIQALSNFNEFYRNPGTSNEPK